MSMAQQFDHILTADEIIELNEQARQEYLRWQISQRIKESIIPELEIDKKIKAEIIENMEERRSLYRRR